MANIYDKRSSKHKNIESRKRFLRRICEGYTETINTDEVIKKNRIEKIFKGSKKVKIKKNSIKEIKPVYDPLSGKTDYVLPGNDRYSKGDTIPLPRNRDQYRVAGKGEDEYVSIMLTEDEFLTIAFGDLELPNFIKQSLETQTNKTIVRAGYTKEAPISRLDIKKTFETAVARKIATKNTTKKPIFLDEEDLRYRNYQIKKESNKKAIMFLLLDISGSVGEDQLLFSKSFFGLLYKFLDNVYDDIELVFIQYTNIAEEVDQNLFFNPNRTGGTTISSGYDLVLQLLSRRYLKNLEDTNFYLVNITDGETFVNDYSKSIETTKQLLKTMSYFFYIEMEDKKNNVGYRNLGGRYETLGEIYSKDLEINNAQNFKLKKGIDSKDSVVNLFREFFRRENNDE